LRIKYGHGRLSDSTTPIYGEKNQAMRTVITVNSGQVEPMPGISHDTAFEGVLSTGFILYHILECACIAADQLRGHLSSGCVGVSRCVVFHRCATKDSP